MKRKGKETKERRRTKRKINKIYFIGLFSCSFLSLFVSLFYYLLFFLSLVLIKEKRNKKWFGQEKTEDYQPWKQVLEVGFCLLLSLPCLLILSSLGLCFSLCFQTFINRDKISKQGTEKQEGKENE